MTIGDSLKQVHNIERWNLKSTEGQLSLSRGRSEITITADLDVQLQSPRQQSSAARILEQLDMLSSQGFIYKIHLRLDPHWELYSPNKMRITLDGATVSWIGMGSEYEPEYKVTYRRKKSRCAIAILKTINFDYAIASAISASKKQGVIDLPEPLTFSDEAFCPSTANNWNPIDIPLELRWYERRDWIMSAVVLAIASLDNQGKFHILPCDPTCNDVWFIVAIRSYLLDSHVIAVRDNTYYLVSGKKYLRINMIGQLRQLGVWDREFIERIITKYCDKMINE